eukprot:TRINITY_DN9620_c0_g1_i1.p1 TRINITY_DN9620_c0_g1~~TRINITY_DN9620_c0_g1_i1.p1  ORF type:complete len:278 (-),score=33.85 TRINITY_DN9620_c0_g1_i1:14-847(-)
MHDTIETDVLYYVLRASGEVPRGRLFDARLFLQEDIDNEEAIGEAAEGGTPGSQSPRRAVTFSEPLVVQEIAPCKGETGPQLLARIAELPQDEFTLHKSGWSTFLLRSLVFMRLAPRPDRWAPTDGGFDADDVESWQMLQEHDWTAECCSLLDVLSPLVAYRPLYTQATARCLTEPSPSELSGLAEIIEGSELESVDCPPTAFPSCVEWRCTLCDATVSPGAESAFCSACGAHWAADKANDIWRCLCGRVLRHTLQCGTPRCPTCKVFRKLTLADDA